MDIKYFFVILAICLSTTFITAQSNSSTQTASVEKSLFSVQTGFFGVWINHESRLSNAWALRSEFGMDGGFSYSTTSGSLFVMAPVLSVQPKWYYNLKKRNDKGKRVDGNAANYISLNLKFHPDWFLITSRDNVNLISDLSIVPQWGMRRTWGKHINFELFTGIGYGYFFKKQAGYAENEAEAVFNLGVRFGLNL